VKAISVGTTSSNVGLQQFVGLIKGNVIRNATINLVVIASLNSKDKLPRASKGSDLFLRSAFGGVLS